MLDSQEVYSRERKLRATFKNHLNSAHLQKVSNTLLQDLVKLPTLQPAYTVTEPISSIKSKMSNTVPLSRRART